MAIEFACRCGKGFRVADELAGRKARCSACKTILVIPASTAGLGSYEPTPPPKSAPTPRSATPPPPKSVRPAVNVPAPPVAPPTKAVNAFGVACFIFGVLGLLICWIPLLNVLVIPLAAIGAILGIVG